MGKRNHLDQAPQPPENVSAARRKLLIIGGILAGIGAVWWGAQKLLQEQPLKKKELDRVEEVQRNAVSAEEFCRRFPKHIPGASEIKNFFTPGAKHCLVHIRQQHGVDHIIEAFEKEFLTPEFVEKLSPEGKARLAVIRAETKVEIAKAAILAAEVDRDIRLIVTHLVEENGVDEIYCEGMSPGVETAFATLPNAIETGNDYEQRLKKILQQLPPDSPRYKETQQTLRDIIASKEKTLASVRDELGELSDLFLVKKIRVKSAEDAEVLQLAMQAIVRGADPETQRTLTKDLREEKLLQKAANNTITTVRFGGGHKLQKRIEHWNEKHPQESFNLIEITPASYRKD